MILSLQTINGELFTKIEGIEIHPLSVKGVKTEKEVEKFLQKIKKDSNTFFNKIAQITRYEQT